MGSKSYRDLEVWKKAMEVAKEANKIAKELPQAEQFELGSQMRRAATSVPFNIA